MKVKVYIDFEAISHLQITRYKGFGKFYQFPYAFSIGVETESGFKTQTFVFDFSKGLTLGRANWLIKKRILFYINDILNNKGKKIGIRDIVFYGYSIKMEKETLSNIFKYPVEVIDLNIHPTVSLLRITKKYMSEKNYFECFKNEMINDEVLINANKRNKSGEYASIAGVALVLAKNKIPNNLFKNVNLNVLNREITEYSRDDILRLKIVNDNWDEVEEMSNLWHTYIKKREKLNKELNLLHSIMSLLEKYDKDDMIADLVVIERESNAIDNDVWINTKLNKLSEIARSSKTDADVNSIKKVILNLEDNLTNELKTIENNVKDLI